MHGTLISLPVSYPCVYGWSGPVRFLGTTTTAFLHYCACAQAVLRRKTDLHVLLIGVLHTA